MREGGGKKNNNRRPVKKLEGEEEEALFKFVWFRSEKFESGPWMATSKTRRRGFFFYVPLPCVLLY